VAWNGDEYIELKKILEMPNHLESLEKRAVLQQVSR
jgi:hypothetical protein